jgi:XTP/dITP diphosphohydrolase
MELQSIPRKHHYVSLKSISCFEDIPETADTIEGNAILKIM